MFGRMVGWLRGWKGGWMGWLVAWLDGWLVGWLRGWMVVGWMDERMDGCIEGLEGQEMHEGLFLADDQYVQIHHANASRGPRSWKMKPLLQEGHEGPAMRARRLVRALIWRVSGTPDEGQRSRRVGREGPSLGRPSVRPTRHHRRRARRSTTRRPRRHRSAASSLPKEDLESQQREGPEGHLCLCLGPWPLLPA